MNSLLTKERKWIIVPIEAKVREFHAKLLLCCVAAEEGYGAILGHGRVIKKKWLKLPRGIYFDKSVAKVNVKRFYNHKKYGNRVVAWCEEGLLLVDKSSYQHRRISHKTLNHVDLFFAWGKHHADVMLEKVPEIKERLFTAGNPRIDLLSKNFRAIFNQDVREIKKQYGDYVLINTNFSTYNHVRGMEAGLAIQKKAGKIVTDEQELFWRRFIKFKKIMFYEFVKMVKALSSTIRNVRIIVRPHPAENHAVWQNYMHDFDNVHVVHEGNVIPWIIGAKVSIHNGCTTGLEAYLLDRPVISYQPPAPAVYDHYLPDVISEQADNLEQLIKLTIKACDSKYISKTSSNSQKDNIIRNYIHIMNGCLASDNIIRQLAQLPVIEQTFRAKKIVQMSRSFLCMGPIIRAEANKIKDKLMIKERYFTKSNKHKNLYQAQEAIFRQEFPATELEEVNQVINKFKEVSGRFDNVKAMQIERNCFAIGKW